MEGESHATNSNASETAPDRPASTASSIAGKVLEIDQEAIAQVESPIVAGPVIAEDENDDDDEEHAGYEESAERDEIIRERINRTQEQMRYLGCFFLYLFF